MAVAPSSAEYPWSFDGRLWFRPALVKTPEGPLPGDVRPLGVFGWTLGGVVYLEYDESPVGPYVEYVTMGSLVEKRGALDEDQRAVESLRPVGHAILERGGREHTADAVRAVDQVAVDLSRALLPGRAEHGRNAVLPILLGGLDDAPANPLRVDMCHPSPG